VSRRHDATYTDRKGNYDEWELAHTIDTSFSASGGQGKIEGLLLPVWR
jgi:hypothetical protein